MANYGRVNNNNGLNVYYRCAGSRDKPLIVLLHGFPETSHSWRFQLEPLSKCGNGYFVIAPDLRGYGKTTGWEWAKNILHEDTKAGAEAVQSFSALNMVKDIVGLVEALGYSSCILVGHDFGTTFSFYTALARPDMVRGLFLISVPLGLGPRPLAQHDPNRTAVDYNRYRSIGMVHYQDYYCQATTAPYFENNTAELLHYTYAGLNGGSKQLAQFHVPSSKDPLFWKGKDPDQEKKSKLMFPLALPQDSSFLAAAAESLGPKAPLPSWMSEEDLKEVVQDYETTGFQGALALYENIQQNVNDFAMFSGVKLQIPYFFLGGNDDFVLTMYNTLLKNLKTDFIPKFCGSRVLLGVGHWVQQEAPETTNEVIKTFLEAVEQSKSKL